MSAADEHRASPVTTSARIPDGATCTFSRVWSSSKWRDAFRAGGCGAVQSDLFIHRILEKIEEGERLPHERETVNRGVHPAQDHAGGSVRRDRD
jgi:hypothetical protein